MFFDGFDDSLLQHRALLLQPPICYGSQLSLSEEFINELILPLVRREEQREVFDPTLLERGR